MKIKPEKAVASVIAYKKKLDKQLSYEQDLMFSRLKKYSGSYEKIQANIGKINGVVLNKKQLKEIKTKSDEIFKQSLNYFRKIKRPASKKPGSTLSGIANPHNKPGGHNGPTPAPQPEPETPQAVCFSSAIRCEGNMCDRTTAMIIPKFESSGVGGPIGIEPFSVRGHSNSLYFLYIPVADGAVNIFTEMILNGHVTADTEGAFLLHSLLPFGIVKCSASAKLTLQLIVWQYDNINNTPAIYSRTEIVAADVYSDDGSWKSEAFVNTLFMLNSSMIVTKDQWLVIEIRAKGDTIGRSYAGIARIDFEKGAIINLAEYGIRVQQLCVVPADPVVVL